MTDLNAIAKITDDAANFARAIPQLSLTGHDISLEEAYDVQKRSIARRQSRGETIIGVKMGFTSRAKQIQMGLDDVIWGHLTDAMWVEDGGNISLKDYVHPRAEPELAFKLGADLTGEVSREQAMAAIEAVAPAIEIIDSRYMNFKFNLPDVVADNTSSSSFVVGEWVSPDFDFSDLNISLEFDGKPVQTGSSNAILGDPVEALMAASRLCAEQGLELKKGWILMAGGATAAEALDEGVSVKAVVEKLSTPSFNVKA